MVATIAEDVATAEDLVEALQHANPVVVKRQMRAVGNDRLQTPWDRAHGFINDLLDDLQDAS